MSEPALTPKVQPFTVAVSDEIIADLRDRLRRTMFAEPADPAPWSGGTDPHYLRELVTYWAEHFDWPAAQRWLNSYPQYLAEIDGRQLHFVWLRGVQAADGPAPLPLVLTHGWPSSFVEMLAIAPLLADPASHGGDPMDAFDVIVPSLPGFLYSDLPREPFTRRGVANMWHQLLTQVLGYQRFAAFGGDIGGGITRWLGQDYPDDVVGVHLISVPLGVESDDPTLTEQERAFLARLAEFDSQDQGYSEIMCTRPNTIAASLIDSPAGLLAWIIDKYRDWSDCGGELETAWNKDTILTVATLYWATHSIASSFQQYYHYELNSEVSNINVPAAITLSHEPAFYDAPKSLAQRLFTDLRRWSTPALGGHFMAHEQPEQTANEIREFLRPLRNA